MSIDSSETRVQPESPAPKSRTKLYGWLLVAGVTVLIGATALIFLLSSQGRPGLSADGSNVGTIQLVSPLNLTASNGVAVTGAEKKNGAPDVVVSIDFQCPACQNFESVYGKKLQEMSLSGEINLEYRPVAILDRASTTKYSSRAMSAFGCVVTSKPESSLNYLNLLMDNQPDEGTAGLTDDRLAEIAAEAGASDMQGCISDHRYLTWASNSTQQALDEGLDHTPYVKINGATWDGKADLLDTIQAAE